MSLDNQFVPFQVTSDKEGNIWVIVGSDSGFEGDNDHLLQFHQHHPHRRKSIIHGKIPMTRLLLGTRYLNCSQYWDWHLPP